MRPTQTAYWQQGQALKQIRTSAGKSKYRVIKDSGLPKPTYYDLEGGEIAMKEAHAKALVPVLGDDVMRIFVGRLGEQALKAAAEVEGATAQLPVYSDISCGWGAEVDERPTCVSFPAAVADRADHAVTIKGDSMIGIGFLPGTTLFIRSQSGAANGQPVIARLGDGTYICKVYRDDGKRRWLEGRSDTFKDRIWFDKHGVEICGVVVSFWGRS
jgi:SOS-response transcriptional repressor LexA